LIFKLKAHLTLASEPTTRSSTANVEAQDYGSVSSVHNNYFPIVDACPANVHFTPLTMLDDIINYCHVLPGWHD
jgi:hypothetical protein